MDNELFDFCKKKKIKLVDLIKFIELLEVTKIELIGDEGIKLGIIDSLREKGIHVNVKKRFNRFNF